MTDQQPVFPILTRLADGIAAMFGRNCEVAVHDLSNVDRSLIHLSGNVTHRKTGAPATDLLVKALTRPEETEDIHNYKTTTKDGRSIKSTTIFIRDSRNCIIGAFCINLDTTDFFNAAQALTPFVNAICATDNGVEENFSATAEETIESIFEQVLVTIGKQPATMSTEERVRLVGQLEEQGVFQMKGSVKRIAKLCGVSKFTIYNHLKSIRQPTHSLHNEVVHETGHPN